MKEYILFGTGWRAMFYVRIATHLTSLLRINAIYTRRKDFSLPGGRWRVVERDGVTYVDDTYNANPTSMIAALETFAALEVKGRRIAVIGDMFELGEQSAALHAQVKARAAELPLDRVILVGENMGGVDRAAARTELAGLVQPGDAVLLKASHGMHLDEMLK